MFKPKLGYTLQLSGYISLRGYLKRNLFVVSLGKFYR